MGITLMQIELRITHILRRNNERTTNESRSLCWNDANDARNLSPLSSSSLKQLKERNWHDNQFYLRAHAQWEWLILISMEVSLISMRWTAVAASASARHKCVALQAIIKLKLEQNKCSLACVHRRLKSTVGSHSEKSRKHSAAAAALWRVEWISRAATK